MQPGAVALTECGLVPALLNIIRSSPVVSSATSPEDGGAGSLFAARRTLIISHAVNILETVRSWRRLGQGVGVMVQLMVEAEACSSHLDSWSLSHSSHFDYNNIDYNLSLSHNSHFDYMLH